MCEECKRYLELLREAHELTLPRMYAGKVPGELVRRPIEEHNRRVDELTARLHDLFKDEQ